MSGRPAEAQPGSSGVPALPSLELSAFPAAARGAIGEAWQAALDAPESADRAGGLAMTLHAWEQWEAAHEAYRRAQALDPGNVDWWYLDGVVLQRLVRTSDAVKAFEAAVARAPGYLPALSRLAETALETGDRETSGRLYGQLEREPAAQPVAAFGHGRLAALGGRHDEAVAHFERAIALFPEFGAAHYGMAMSLRSLGRRDEAAAALARHRTFGARWPGIDDPRLSRVTALKDDPRAVLTRGLRLADQGDLAGAIAAHEEAVRRNPALAQAHANLISLYGRTGNWGRAEEHYRAVVALGFNLDDAHYGYGVLLSMQERWAEAADAYRQAIAVNPYHPQANNNLGQLLERDRLVAEAEAAYRRAVESQPSFRLARFNLARMLVALGRAEDAVRQLQRTLEPRDAETPRYLFALAAIHVRSGRVDEGIRLAEEARALAAAHDQQELVATIDRDLAALRSAR